MRKPIPDEVQNAVLLAARRRCCICYGLHRDLGVKRGQLAHLDQNPQNSQEDNIAFVCLEHHDLYDSSTSQSKGYTVSEVKHFREELYAELRRRDEAEAIAASAEVDQEAHGDGDIRDRPFVDLPVNNWEHPPASYPDFLRPPAAWNDIPRTFLFETVLDIRNALRKIPPLDRERIGNDTYGGKWLRISGTICNVREGDECYVVQVSTADDKFSFAPWVLLTFPKNWRPDVDPLRVGDRLSAEGQIRSVDQVELINPVITRHARQRSTS